MISTNSSQTPNEWYLDRFNDKYYTNNSDFSVGILNSNDNTIASNWTIAPADVPTTPEPSAILGLLVMGSLGVLSRKRKV